MIKKFGKKQSLRKRPRALDPERIFPIGETKDLFDQVRVTWPEIELWTREVAGIGPDSWRFAYYVENWNVTEKVRQAKLNGTWPPSSMSS